VDSQLDTANAPAATLASAAQVDLSHQFPWSIPNCAWKHSLGDTPVMDQENPSPLNTKTRTRKGMPLGGIGAGNFMYNVSGSFGPWVMKPNNERRA
jgi:hypothetical protein